MRSSLYMFVIATALSSAIPHALAQAPTQTPAPKPASKVTPPANGTSSSRPALGTLLDQATAMEERDISVLITSGNETTLSSQMAGRIRKVHAGLGDTVAAQAVILEFDCEEQIAQFASAEAEYRGARETHLTKLRLQALGAAGELEVTVAAAAADKAKSQVVLRESQLAYCKVTAPFGGRLVKLRVKQSESVTAGQPLLDLVNPGSLKAQLYVPAAWLSWIRTGLQFSVKTSADGPVYRARISKLNARVEGVSQSLELEGRFEGSTQGLLPGMVGTAVFVNRPKP